MRPLGAMGSFSELSAYVSMSLAPPVSPSPSSWQTVTSSNLWCKKSVHAHTHGVMLARYDLPADSNFLRLPMAFESSSKLSTISFEHIELPAKILDYFLRSNKSNINQSARCVHNDCLSILRAVRVSQLLFSTRLNFTQPQASTLRVGKAMIAELTSIFLCFSRLTSST